MPPTPPPPALDLIECSFVYFLQCYSLFSIFVSFTVLYDIYLFSIY